MKFAQDDIVVWLHAENKLTCGIEGAQSQHSYMRIPVPGDGNCLFYAYALSLYNDIKKGLITDAQIERLFESAIKRLGDIDLLIENFKKKGRDDAQEMLEAFKERIKRYQNTDEEGRNKLCQEYLSDIAKIDNRMALIGHMLALAPALRELATNGEGDDAKNGKSVEHDLQEKLDNIFGQKRLELTVDSHKQKNLTEANGFIKNADDSFPSVGSIYVGDHFDFVVSEDNLPNFAFLNAPAAVKRVQPNRMTEPKSTSHVAWLDKDKLTCTDPTSNNKHGFTRIPVPQDGNSLFYAYAIGLCSAAKKGEINSQHMRRVIEAAVKRIDDIDALIQRFDEKGNQDIAMMLKTFKSRMEQYRDNEDEAKRETFCSKYLNAFSDIDKRKKLIVYMVSLAPALRELATDGQGDFAPNGEPAMPFHLEELDKIFGQQHLALVSNSSRQRGLTSENGFLKNDDGTYGTAGVILSGEHFDFVVSDSDVKRFEFLKPPAQAKQQRAQRQATPESRTSFISSNAGNGRLRQNGRLPAPKSQAAWVGRGSSQPVASPKAAPVASQPKTPIKTKVPMPGGVKKYVPVSNGSNGSLKYTLFEQPSTNGVVTNKNVPNNTAASACTQEHRSELQKELEKSITFETFSEDKDFELYITEQLQICDEISPEQVEHALEQLQSDKAQMEAFDKVFATKLQALYGQCAAYKSVKLKDSTKADIAVRQTLKQSDFAALLDESNLAATP